MGGGRGETEGGEGFRDEEETSGLHERERRVCYKGPGKVG